MKFRRLKLVKTAVVSMIRIRERLRRWFVNLARAALPEQYAALIFGTHALENFCSFAHDRSFNIRANAFPEFAG